MHVAFYAPLKPPDHGVPSGDRRMARLLIEALELAGHEVEVAARLRSWHGVPDAARQARIAELGAKLAERLLRRYRRQPAATRPRAWLTYHLYYKAPDWIGPRVAEALGIPYLLAEASLANKRAGGPWALGHEAARAAFDRAAAVISLNPDDVECLPDPGRVRPMAPFLDPAPYQAAAAAREAARTALTEAHDLDPARPWLLAVAMMRPGDKLASYRLLAAALQMLGGSDWQLLVAGDGPARAEVAAALGAVPRDRVRLLGEVAAEALPALYAACDLLVWPAIHEAYGMTLLEAQAAGLPVVAGQGPGVAQLVLDGGTGRLTEAGDAVAFAQAVADLLAAPETRRAMASAAQARVAAEHGLTAAAAHLDAVLREAAAP
ncbi:MAG: glycosyltransferase family 4 protein [Alphaproteobacteria bacterium]